MAKYGKKASAKVKKALHARKRGQLKSGAGKTVKSRKQAIAIGLSEAREAGAEVPSEKKSSRKSTSRKKSSRKSAPRKATTKKSASRKTTKRNAKSRKTATRKSASKK